MNLQLRPARATLRMFDATELPTLGMVTTTVKHPRTGDQFDIEFYITEREEPILGIEACRRLDMLRVVEENICTVQDTAATAQGLTSADVFTQYSDLFDGSLGCMSGEVHLEVDPHVPPVQMPLRRIPVALRDQVKTELDKLVANKVIAPVTEPTKWVSALLVVQKPTGQGVRICIDPKFLNRALIRSTYYMQTIDDILPQLANVKVMSTVDIKQAFWMLQLDHESSMLTTFETPYGRYRWLRLPMGTKVSPEIFAARIQAALAGLNGVHVIADDLLITGCGSDTESATRDHDKNVLALLERCRQQGIKLNKDKLSMNRKSVMFMGHVLTSEGLKPDKRKVEAIVRMPRPENKAALQRLLGMATFLARYCPNFSQVTAPLRQLLAENNEFLWDVRHTEALDKLKQLLTHSPVLRYFSPALETIVQCDASSFGISAVLMQDGAVVEYASRALTEGETNWAQIEKELLSIQFGCERFHTYLYARHFKCQTDHRPLLAIHKKALGAAPKRLQRMLMRLQQYDVELEFVPGSQLILADTLSRAVPPQSAKSVNSSDADELAALTDEQLSDLHMVASQKTINAIRAAAADDAVYQQLKQQIVVGWPPTGAQLMPDLKPYHSFADELTVCGDFVFKGHRVVVPASYRETVLDKLHSVHIGINSCIRRAREVCFWPGITADIKKRLSACDICIRVQNELSREPLRSHESPSRPFEKVGVDLFSFHGQDYILIVDYLSNYYEVDRLPSKKMSDIIYVLKQQWARHGIPCIVFSDNQFSCQEFRKFADAYEFEHVTSSPRFPQSNGKVENAIKTCKKLMLKSLESGADPFLALLEWRNCPSEQLSLSPVQLLMGRRTRTPLPIVERQLLTPTAQDAKSALISAKRRQAHYYNRSTRDRATLPVGQTVRMRYDEHDWRKAEVARILPHRSYEVTMPDGSRRRRTSKHVRFSNEPPIFIDQDINADSQFVGRKTPSSPPPPLGTDTYVSCESAPVSTNRPDSHDSSQAHQAQPKQDTAAGPMKTRSGRIIRRPARYSE